MWRWRTISCAAIVWRGYVIPWWQETLQSIQLICSKESFFILEFSIDDMTKSIPFYLVQNIRKKLKATHLPRQYLSLNSNYLLQCVTTIFCILIIYWHYSDVKTICIWTRQASESLLTLPSYSTQKKLVPIVRERTHQCNSSIYVTFFFDQYLLIF